jgi:signal transduction histidine kinase
MIENATAVGKLAAGLAHEIRNPLHAIQINLHSFRRVHERKAELPDEEISRMLDQSSQEIARIEHLMQQLTGFATPDEPREEVIDVTSEIGDVVDFIGQELLDSDIQLRTQIPDRPVWVRMDHGRLRQIMLNLLQNAQQAMKQGGQIQVSLSSRRGRVSLTIADNGPGIGAEHRKQVFEPFFSTRKDGVGLGLALVKRFVDEVDGEIHCVENPPNGVMFRIVLPEATGPRG